MTYYFLDSLTWLWSLFAPNPPPTSEQLETLTLQKIWLSNLPIILLTCLWGLVIFECWLYFLQYNVFHKFKTRTSSLTRLQSHLSFIKARSYCIHWNLFESVSKLIKISILTWLIYSDTLFKAYFQTKTSPTYRIPTTDPLTFWSSPGPHILTLLGWTSKDGFLLRFFLLLTAFINLVQLPFSLYYTFFLEPLYRKPCQFTVLEQWRHFLCSHIKSIWLALFLSCPLLGLISNLEFGESVNPILFKSAFISLVIMRFLAVELLSFLYFRFVNDFTQTHVPLEQCSLRNKIERLAERVNLTVTHVLIMKDPKDTKGTCTSRFCGFQLNRRMVIVDTLIRGDPKLEEETLTEDQIEAIFACHLGHWKMRHGIQLNLLECLHLFGALFIFSWFTTSNVQSFILFGALGVSLEILGCGESGLFINYWKRKFVYESDKIAVTLLGKRKASKHWKSALVKMAKRNLEFDVWDPLYKAWFHDKPTLRQRVEAVEHLGLLASDDADDQQNAN